MKVRYAVGVAIILHVASLAAQPIMQNVYTVLPWNNSGLHHGAVNADGGFTLVARPHQNDSIDPFNMVLLHTDEEGSLMWAREYLLPGSQMPWGIARGGDGSSWVIGEDHLIGPNLDRGLLMRVHAADDLPIWAFATAPSTEHELLFMNVVPLGDDVIVLGSIEDSTSLGTDVLLMRVAPDGSIVWSRRMVSAGLHLFEGLTVTANERIIMAGRGIGSGGELGVAIIAVSAQGAIEWTRLYGDVLADVNTVVEDPQGGFLISGTYWPNDVPVGLVMHTNEQGIATDMWRYAYEVLAGYPLADGSQVLFIKHPGGVAHMQRVSTTGDVPWVAEVGPCISWPQLLSYAEGSRYAFITGDFAQTNTISLTTFNANCTSCTGQPGVALAPLDAWLVSADLTVGSTPYPLQTELLTIGYGDYEVVGSTSCMLPIGMDEHATQELNCSFDPVLRTAIIEVPGAERVALSVHDAIGRQLPLTTTRTEGQVLLDVGDAARFAPGVYTVSMHAKEGTKACRFVVGDR